LDKKVPVKKPEPKAKSKSKSVLSVSPSAWMVWKKCALSLQSVKTSFQLERDEYALAGTALHKAISDTLFGKEVVLENDDDEVLVRFAVDTVMNDVPCREDAYFEVDDRIECVVNGVDFSGTADCSYYDGDTIVIPDFKTGWREVEAEGNSQLKIYAHAKAKENKAIKKWRGIIINARFNSVSFTGGEIEPDYLSNTAKDIISRTAKKQLKTGNQCAYCQRLTTCKPLRDAIALWIKPGAIDSITREPERLAEALRLAKPAEKLFDTIKKEAQLFIDLGGEIPGVIVEYTAGQRTWPKDMNVPTIADRIGVPLEEMIEESIVSPAEATRRGADKDAINAIAIRPPRKGFKFV
jgi:hypothetical protein